MSTSPISQSPQKDNLHEHIEDHGRATLNEYTRNINAKYVNHNPPILILGLSPNLTRIINPLNRIPKKDLFDQVSRFCADHGLQDKETTFRKGALVAQSPMDFENIPELDENDKYHLRREASRMSWNLSCLISTHADADMS